MILKKVIIKIQKNIEKEELVSYFLNFNANFAANPQENKVIPIGNMPLERTCGTCSNETEPEEYIAATTGKATSPSTPSFVFVFSETLCCMSYVLIVILWCKVYVVLRRDLTFLSHFVQLLTCIIRSTGQFMNSRE